MDVGVEETKSLRRKKCWETITYGNSQVNAGMASEQLRLLAMCLNKTGLINNKS